MRPSPRTRRVAAGAVCVVGAGVVAEAAGRLAESDEHSPGTIAAVLMGSIVAVGGGLLAVAPERCWRPLLSGVDRIDSRIRAGQPPHSSRAGVALIFLGCVVYTVLLALHLPHQPDPSTDDQGAYLEVARQIRDNGGIPGLVASLYAGEFAEANRHPLYLAILSVAPTESAGRLISQIIGAMSLIGFTLVTARRSGWLTAGLFCVLLATNDAFCQFSTRVVCEVLLTAVCGAVWFAVLNRDSTENETAGRRGSKLGRHALIGALLGLAYLAKGTGLLVALAYFVWLFLSGLMPRERPAQESKDPGRPDDSARRRRRLPWMAAACTVVTFVVIASPLLVRNVRRFHNPFYNVNSLLLFADDYSQFEGMVASGTTTAESADAYFATHSVFDVVQREVSGVVWELFIILRSLGPTPLDDARVLFGAGFLLCALFTLCALGRWADGLLVVWGLLFWVVFAWYVPIAAGERFVLPLLIPMLSCTAEGIARLVCGPDGTAARRLAWGAAGWAVFWVVMTGLFVGGFG